MSPRPLRCRSLFLGVRWPASVLSRLESLLLAALAANSGRGLLVEVGDGPVM
ncbi:hypothetical protein HMPREF0972_01664 [Actinomyces sp. oral taxon 848 str. F0332]|nr:hypothetical protein HMPREF0972_01664 [Actinomyces sp. oral taxon 848 str. F0332]